MNDAIVLMYENQRYPPIRIDGRLLPYDDAIKAIMEIYEVDRFDASRYINSLPVESL